MKPHERVAPGYLALVHEVKHERQGELAADPYEDDFAMMRNAADGIAACLPNRR
jgi:hypothetical protein